MAIARLTVWSDYLCPWCYNAAVRLERMEEEFGDLLEIEWRTFLLRPHPRGGPPGFPSVDDPPRRVSVEGLAKFARYTESWQRPAAEPDSGEFHLWDGETPPPSHSVPPHVAAKAAASLGADAFRALHRRLLAAYFTENRDITDRSTLTALWAEAGLDGRDFDRCDDPAHLQETLKQHEEAADNGVTGVPAAKMEGNEAIILGANPVELYRRWIQKKLDGKI
ncbi:MAG: DsbA family protein [Deltaproteobacteria bacterium]|nr:DsbA family protein [Deltaproteobacteria bacterium]MBW2446030.1 DsbA family protein [Deltaproteobacteria bacterium]